MDPKHFYIDKDGRYVFTEEYHLQRGFCCQSGCRHCPYGFNKKLDPNIPAEYGSFESSESSEIVDEDYLEKIRSEFEDE